MNVRSVSPLLPTTAEDWVARLQSPDCATEEHLAFEDWLAADPRNPVDYANAEHLYSLSAQLARDPQLMTLTRSAHVRTDASDQRRWPLAIAASIAIVGALGYWKFLSGTDAPPQQFQTAIGERNESILGDGSRLVLDADTVIDVAYARDERALNLVRGRVQVEATPDPHRPMVVHVANGSVRVVGTTFQVQHLADRVEVGLLEGAVTVATDGGRTKALSAGQQAGYDRHGNILQVRPLSLSDAQAWTRGQLVFSESPLGTIIQEANRYSVAQIRLATPELGTIPISGAFQADDQAALVDALVAGWHLRAEHDVQGNIILSRRQ